MLREHLRTLTNGIEEVFLKTALICGATQGIGLALTEALLKNSGFSKVGGTYRGQAPAAELQKLADRHPKKCVLLSLDPKETNSFKKFELSTFTSSS